MGEIGNGQFCRYITRQDTRSENLFHPSDYFARLVVSLLTSIKFALPNFKIEFFDTPDNPNLGLGRSQLCEG